ncbi:hypothetical protein KFE25_010137 [Diacronema lutheri]|uniref:Oxidation resistance protein 1 n=1 Tax=Diacronema lutheri TaxID=2081491 RepID=A0A8J6C9P2_DIALT|nr:hypothetical protein KFE25_010137 [Diacronema lutheri]
MECTDFLTRWLAWWRSGSARGSGPFADRGPRGQRAADDEVLAPSASAHELRPATGPAAASSDGGILFAIPLEVLLLHVLPRLELPEIVAVSSTCLVLRTEVDACAGLWSRLRAGCASRAEFQEAFLRSCARCSAPEASEYTFEHSQGLCAHCASRMPSRALKEFLNARTLREWRIGAAQRARARCVLREVLRMAAERTRRHELGLLAERPLRLAFSSHRDGHSHNLLLHTLNAHAPTLLVCHEQPRAGPRAAPAQSFGVFVPVRMLRRTAPAFKSDEGKGAFFFRLPAPPRPRGKHDPMPPAAPAASIWPGDSWSDGRVVGVPHFYATSAELVAFGGDASAYALRLSSDLQTGFSLPCPAFRSPTLAAEPAFRVRCVEAWRVVGEEEEHLEWQSAQAQGRPVRSLDEEEPPAIEGADNAASVLEPGSNRFMLEFVNMREDLLLQRRAQ